MKKLKLLSAIMFLTFAFSCEEPEILPQFDETPTTQTGDDDEGETSLPGG